MSGPRPAWRRCRGERAGGKRPGWSLKRSVGSAQTLGEAFPNFAFWLQRAGFWPTVFSSCLIPNRWVCALPPPGSGSGTPRLIQGPQKAGRGLLQGGQGAALSGGLLSPQAGGGGCLGPAPPWCTPLSQHVVSAAATQMLWLPPHGETISPVVKHVDTGPSGPTLNPTLQTFAGHPWASVLASLCLCSSPLQSGVSGAKTSADLQGALRGWIRSLGEALRGARP